MSDDGRRTPKVLRVERHGVPRSRVPPAGSTMEERIEAVWTLTLACLAWRPEGEREPRLMRSVAAVHRPARRPVKTERATGRTQDLADVERLERDGDRE